ncbi:MAG: hypothetical protein KA138_07345 [Saprospiraceae bacterium]|nr:hypothetical protein [Saprospiraceae bacterium]
MRAGIIAEGKSDLAVITNILKGALGISRSDVQYLVPELDYDETDLAQMRVEQFSNWTIVKKRCEEGFVVKDFFEGVDDQRFLVIHIDTAERLEVGFEVSEPRKLDEADYVSQVREAVVLKLKEWLGDNFNERTAFAVAVEETDAWLIPIFDSTISETGFYPRPKERLLALIHRPNVMRERDRRQFFQLDEYSKFFKLSNDLRRSIKLNQCAERNESLKLFCSELKQFLT